MKYEIGDLAYLKDFYGEESSYIVEVRRIREVGGKPFYEIYSGDYRVDEVSEDLLRKLSKLERAFR